MVVWGSLSLAQSLINHDVIDEYRLFVCPIVLQSGRPLFSDTTTSMNMKLLNARTFDHGAVALEYAHEQ
jgi:dihydrofolate reductase